MSDSSGFSNIPSSPQRTGQDQRAPTPEPPNARLTKTPDSMREIKQTTRLRGEVVQQTRDSRTQETTLRIRTNRGEIEVRLPPEQTPPREGTQVDLELQPGRPPQTVRIEQAPPETTPVDERHATRPTTTAQPRAEDTPAPPRASATPINIEVGTHQITEPPPNTRAPPETAPPLPRTLPASEIQLRLQPITPRELTTLLAQRPTPEIITATLTPISESQIIAVQTTEAALNQTLSTTTQPPVSAVQSHAPPPQTILQPPGQTPPLLQPNEPALILNLTPAPLNPSRPLPIQNTQPSPSAFNSVTLPQFNTPKIASLLPTLSTTALPATAPILTTPTAPAPAVPTAKQPLDIRINAALPPEIQFIAPGTERANDDAI